MANTRSPFDANTPSSPSIPMTDRDEKYLRKLQDYFQQHQSLPSFSQAAEVLGLKSKSAVSKAAQRLKSAGYLASAAGNGRLVPGQRFFEKPVIAAVQDGVQLPDDGVQTVLGLDQMLIKAPPRTVFVKVKGDSMVEAGLLDGDWVIVQRNAPVLPGQIVVAVVDNELAVRYLDVDAETSEFYLRPANRSLAPLQQRDPELFGRVLGAFRAY